MSGPTAHLPAAQAARQRPAQRARRPLTAACGAVLLSLLAQGTLPAPASAAAGLCPDATPTADQLVPTFDRLSAAMSQKAARTGVGVRVRSGYPFVRSWAFDANTSLKRAASHHEYVDREDSPVWRALRGSYVDLEAHRSYRLLSLGEPTLNRLEDAAIFRLWKGARFDDDEFEFLWLRTTTKRKATWPYPGYLDVMDRFARDVLTQVQAPVFRCTATASELTVTATGTQDVAELAVTLDGDGAPTAFELREGDVTDEGPANWNPVWTASITYAQASLRRPLVSYDTTQFRKLAVGGATLVLRSDVLSAARTPVAKAGSHAKRVALLRKISAKQNAAFLRAYNRDTSIPVTATAVRIKGGKAYTVRVGRAAVGKVTFRVVGKKITTRTTLPKRPQP